MIIIKIALCGYKGKTGSKVYELLVKNNYEVIGIEKEENELIDYIEDVDLIIDFTNKENAFINIYLCLEFHKPFIIGTTGFNKEELKAIKQLCDVNKVKGVICYNFALPLNYLFKQINNFTNYYKDISFFDIHHVSKKDKKSGTSYLLTTINENIKVKSYQSNNKVITYMLQLKSKYDKIIVTYQVNDKMAFALGLLEYIKTNNERLIFNLIG